MSAPNSETPVPAASAASQAPASAGPFPVPLFPVPLFRDPVTDGAADPTVIRHHETGEWWMFYTRRRPDDNGPGVSWVHGTRIGIARSPDGRTWHAAGLVDGLVAASASGAARSPTAGAPATEAPSAAEAPAGEAPSAAGLHTHWAPEVIHDGTAYRLYLSLVDGVPDRWEGHPRRIVEYRSPDLERWTRIRDLPLSSDRVIDACVAHCPDGLWRLWYKDEAHDSTTWVASSPDLGDEHEWRVEGEAIGGRPHEGPNVFELGGWWWMLVDEWRGFGVHRSADAVEWHRQGGPDDVLLGTPPSGRHGDVVTDGDRAVLYYFTHPFWNGAEIAEADAREARVTWLQAAGLAVRDGMLIVGG